MVDEEEEGFKVPARAPSCSAALVMICRGALDVPCCPAVSKLANVLDIAS
jgi:hypothetical protein